MAKSRRFCATSLRKLRAVPPIPASLQTAASADLFFRRKYWRTHEALQVERLIEELLEIRKIGAHLIDGARFLRQFEEGCGIAARHA
jgi:hypothetical protein